MEPYYLVFQWSSWYVWGWCLERKDYRLFKLNRMDRVAEMDKEFACRNAPMPDLSNEKIFPGGIKVKALFTPDMKWRLVEEFGPHCFTESDDGRLLFTADYTDMEKVEFFTYDEGMCVQCMHIGAYDDEPATVEAMHRFMEEQGYVLDITNQRMHHEIYLSDARKVAPEKLKTVVRHPIKVKG